MMIPSWSSNVLNAPTLTYIPNTTIALFYWLHACHTSSLAVLGLALLSVWRRLEGDCTFVNSEFNINAPQSPLVYTFGSGEC